ncbi:16S rRNA (guanine(966)-N(2))-methyltransferase RsmD [Jhaorihella thermophila]|uniref:16S rRNA (Guanine966-N2)-methyltransferase n=1 Tax=Jhaorihella thermophila TaxID=488547 RepID=A0A1H5YAT2_9RHOB|nr:16S rRNA (guanine(966)-N(2))-methyltransferase RsmD [Jhaorihella thermophila]SEG20566.1 16S rRNA (guanine966-N2)-methyltransferase [Jhaorihella thermophila]
MRIIAGRFRGLTLASVGKGDRGAHLRPTSDRVREALFSMLESRGAVAGARVLDLFAGTGALGLEALSRGAEQAAFVDDGRVAQDLIRRNISLTGTEDRTRLIRRDATRLPPCPDAPYGLVFLDPPYGKGLGQRALDVSRAGGWIAAGALILWEESAPMPPLVGFELLDARRYGDTHVTLMQAVTV